MHIFLTGGIGAGKSTVIQKTIAILNIDYGGFRTYFGRDRADPNRCLYIGDAACPLDYNEQHVIARFRPTLPPEVYTEVFDGPGAGFIRDARKDKHVIVMDECGRFEQKSVIFQHEVLRTLDGGTPILGVIRQSDRDWTAQVRNHPRIRLFTVDAGNRDTLPAMLAAMIRAAL